MSSATTISKYAEKLFSQKGCELIEYKDFYTSGVRVIRCFADLPGGGITIDVCAGLNKALSAWIEENSSIAGAWRVEVSSPGLDRKLKTLDDFRRVIGKPVLIWLKEPYKEKTYIEAEIIAVNDQSLTLLADEDTFEIPLAILQTIKEKL